jgi:proteasome lid subunit RPN8/RPN11
VIALESFSALYGGDQVEIVAGEIVADEHELVRRYPERFRPGHSGGGSGRSRPRAAVRSDEVELRREPAQFEVHITPSVRAAIEEEIHHANWACGQQVESGGRLYALDAPTPGRGVFIVHASGPGASGSHAKTSARVSRPSEIEAEFSDTLTRARLVEVGLWHSHPPGDDEPSRQDLTTWTTARDTRGGPYVGVIALPAGELGWTYPHFRAWLLEREFDPVRSKSGPPTCTPARVVE